MSNARDCALYFLNLGPACPPLSALVTTLRLLDDSLPEPIPVPGYTVAVADDALVKFDGQESIPYWGEWLYQFEGQKKDYAPDTAQWNMINWNCGQAEFSFNHPDFLGQRAVRRMSQQDVPGAPGRKDWMPTGEPIPKTLALPNHLKTAADALAWIKSLPAQVTASDGSGFHA